MTIHEGVTDFHLDKGIAKLLTRRVAEANDGAVFLLPARLGPVGGLYRDSHVTSVKELQAEGVPIEFLHSAGERTALSEYSEDLIFVFAVGIAQSMTWDAAKALWRYLCVQAQSRARDSRAPIVRLDVARIKRDDLEIEGLSLTSPVNDETAERFMRLLIGRDDDPGSHDDTDISQA